VTQGEVKEVAEAAAEEALRKMFLTLGVDISDPESVIKMQADFKHVRRWRQATETVGDTGLKAAVKFLVTAGLGSMLVWLGWKAVGG
jgi:hypothetical protein